MLIMTTFIQQRFSPLFCDEAKSKQEKKFEAAKYHWSESRVKVFLVIRRHCVSQVDTAGQNLADYEYKDVEYMAKVVEHPGAFVLAVGGFGRLHLFLTEQRDDVMRTIQQASRNNIGYEIWWVH